MFLLTKLYVWKNRILHSNQLSIALLCLLNKQLYGNIKRIMLACSNVEGSEKIWASLPRSYCGNVECISFSFRKRRTLVTNSEYAVCEFQAVFLPANDRCCCFCDNVREVWRRFCSKAYVNGADWAMIRLVSTLKDAVEKRNAGGIRDRAMLF